MKKVITLLIVGITFALASAVSAPKLDKNPAPRIINAPKWKAKPIRFMAKGVKVIRVALLDTGINVAVAAKENIPLCKTGHFNAVTNKEGIKNDLHGHGTEMARAISQMAEGAHYCIISIGFIPSTTDDEEIVKYEIRGLKAARRAGANIINMSFRGPGFNPEEYSLLKSLSRNKTILMAAVGNERTDLNQACLAYPACYQGIANLFPVGAKDTDETPAKYSNYGAMVKIWEYGTFEETQGTSIATALATGRMVKFWSDKLNESSK